MPVVLGALPLESPVRRDCPANPGWWSSALPTLQKTDGLTLAQIAELAVRKERMAFWLTRRGRRRDLCSTTARRETLRTIRSNLPAAFTFAVAGSLRVEDIAAAIETDADVDGVRGAACESGRASRVSSAAVARLVETLDQAELSRRAGPPAGRVVSARAPRAPSRRAGPA